MHTTVDYKTEEVGIEAADKKALKDLEEFVGKEKYKNVIKEAQEAYKHGPLNITFGWMEFVFSFAGVRGYPVKAFCRKYLPDMEIPS